MALQAVQRGEFEHFGTVMPRAICVSGFFVGFATPALFLMLNQRGHADRKSTRLNSSH